ncbi:MAG: hypothetical protein ACYC63_02745 [Armatimonadota bacterium]
MRMLLICLALGVAGVVCALPEPGLELANSGFEVEGATAGQPAQWTSYVTFPGQASVSLDRQVRNTGERSLRVRNADNTRCSISQYVRPKAEGAHTFSCAVRAEAGSVVPVQLQIQWFKLADWPRQIALVDLGQPSPAVIPAGQWLNIAATGSRPAGADLALLVIIVGNGQTPAGTVWADDCKFRSGAYPEPIVSNPGFETDANADGQPDFWGPFKYGGGFELKQDTMVARSGSASASATGAREHGDRSGYYQATPLFTPPAKVRLSYWYKGTGQSALTMHLLTPAGVQKPGGGIEYGAMTATPELSAQWQQFSREIDVPAEAREAGIMRLDIILYQRGEGTIWYDDVKVELVE